MYFDHLITAINEHKTDEAENTSYDRRSVLKSRADGFADWPLVWSTIIEWTRDNLEWEISQLRQLSNRSTF